MSDGEMKASKPVDMAGRIVRVPQVVQIQTAQISMGAISVPVVYALNDIGEVFVTSPAVPKPGMPGNPKMVYQPWEKLPPFFFEGEG